MRQSAYQVGRFRHLDEVASSSNAASATKRRSQGNKSLQATLVASAAGPVAFPGRDPAHASLGRSIRAGMKAVCEGVLVIGVFTTIIIAILALKTWVWTPLFHR